ncbi:MAG: rRNA maturation RNase YbeY [Bacteroidaceae bacterium]|nr:rRNA maturation RNase YbeY [Bacteroidaceae bacterium]
MITYNAINVPLPEIEQDRVSDWIARVAASYGKRIDQVNYIFVDDEEILRINRQFIGHDYYTDHIGFDNCQGNFLSGDTYISLDTVRTNAELFGTPYEEELHRVIIHSILHLCGIDDHTDEERQEMEQAENAALSHFALNPNR